MLARHHATGFPASVVRPAAIYGPDNNIFDMELPMFLRLLGRRPILVPHGGLVVGSYGHVDDLCGAMVALVGQPGALGQVFNVSGESITVNRYIDLLADIVGAEPDVVPVSDDVLAERPALGDEKVFSHLFGVRHHAMLDMGKLRALGISDRFDLRTGHEDAYAWFRRQGYADLDGPLVDPVWGASWDFDAEAAVAARVRGA
jgi:nucleoside-diphosphate-sugar epimerase